MNILADENIEAPIIARLRADGHVVTAIAEVSPGISDTEVLQKAVQLPRFQFNQHVGNDMSFIMFVGEPFFLALLSQAGEHYRW